MRLLPVALLAMFALCLGRAALADQKPAGPASPASCQTEIPHARDGALSQFAVEVDPETAWRPQQTQVRFIIAPINGGTLPAISRVYACFRWAPVKPHGGSVTANAAFRPSLDTANIPDAMTGGQGFVEYGAVMPVLQRLDWHDTAWTAVHTVPLAEMQVLIEMTDGSWSAVILPVGVTFIWSAFAVVALAFLVLGISLWRIAPKALTPPPPPEESGWRVPIRALSSRLLALISDANGVASLAQLQILFWTLIVAIGAIYVMVLSGNLLPISDGTLVLLGIAGGTTILVRLTPSKMTVPADTYPAWLHLFKKTPNDKDVDVTRVQMVIFTLVTGAFVTIKVLSTYSIPDIPDQMQILMGISNGVYLAGRHAPSS